ncbi:MAG: bile acid:sodium symporter family protein [Selenomonadaceae bacterium]|nr:bile acid:sodium symporter family protein [Selenomonadaceae bacterium]
MKKFCKLFTDNLAALVLFAGILGLTVPSSFTWVGAYIPFMIGVVMFGMGMTLTPNDFREVFRRPVEILIGVVAQFTIMPLVAFALTKIFNLPPELAIGVILLGTCPGGTASNIIAYLARGDVALSVSMTMTTTLMSPIVTPLLTYWLAGAQIEVSLTAMMLSIAKIVLAPILTGLALNHFFSEVTKKIQPILPVISSLAMIFVVGSVVSLSADKILSVGLTVAAVVILHNACGLSLGYFAAKIFRMDSRKARTVAIEVGMQNSGLTVSLAMIYFAPLAAIPGAIFSVWHNFSGSLIANYFARREQ